MPSANPIQTNFTSGELSPRMLGRVDLEQYRNGAAELRNFLVLPTGGATKRPGSYYVARAKVAAGRVRLVPFAVSNVAAYVLEFGAGYVRFFRNRGPVLGGATPLELAAPWALDHLRALRITQSNDVMTVCHVAYAPREIRRTSADTFEIVRVQFEDGPYDRENIGDPGANGPSPAASAPETGAPPPEPDGSGSGSGDPAGTGGAEGTGDGGVGGEGGGEAEAGGGGGGDPP